MAADFTGPRYIRHIILWLPVHYLLASLWVTLVYQFYISQQGFLDCLEYDQ